MSSKQQTPVRAAALMSLIRVQTRLQLADTKPLTPLECAELAVEIETASTQLGEVFRAIQEAIDQ